MDDNSKAIETVLQDKTPEEMEMILSIASQLATMTTRNVKKVERASDEEWSELKKSEHIVTREKNKLQVKTTSAKTISDLNQLMDSAKSKKHLRGTIVGVQSVALEEEDATKAKALEEAKKRTGVEATSQKDDLIDDISTWVAEIQYGEDTCKVLIPSYELFPYKVTDNRSPEQEAIIHNRMYDMIGSEIEFVILHVQKGKKLAFASRLQALDDNGWANYKRETRSGKPRIKVGDIAEAQVVAVRKHGIIVDVNGAECILNCNPESNHLSWDYLEDCHELFKINDIIPVKVNEINTVTHKVYNRTYNLIRAKVSHKETIENPIDKYWDSIRVGEIGLATVTNISDARVFCKYKNRVDILCKAPSHGDAAYIGQTRKVEITIKKEEPGKGKRIFGVFKAD